ncbi:MAG: CPBP family glutamic-type intramembrane protease [archaeon]
MDIWTYFHSMTSWMVPLALGLFTTGVILPFHSIMSVTGPSRRWPLPWAVFINPVLEEVIFRLLLLTFLSNLFGFTVAVIMMSVIYAIYMGILYGTPSMADGLVLGVFLSFAMLEFGFPVVLAAHIIYRAAFSLW